LDSSRDDSITISEILAAVNHVLNGCDQINGEW
jgi:hypothetical protein